MECDKVGLTESRHKSAEVINGSKLITTQQWNVNNPSGESKDGDEASDDTKTS